MGELSTLDGPIAIPVQASSDEAMVALWLGNYRSPATQRGYGGDIKEFRDTVQKPLRAVTLGDIQAYGLGLTHVAAVTAARRLSAVKSLFKLAHRIGYLPFDVGAPIQLPAVKNTLAGRILTEEQTLRLLGMVRERRNAALVRVIYYAGLRISEACALHWRDCIERENDQGQITVFGKGGKTRNIVLPPATWSRLVALQGNRGLDDAVFPSRKRGASIQSRQVDRIVKLAAARAGLSTSVSTHWLRHAHASHALDRGAPVHVVQSTLGHASLSTTTRYTHARPGDSSARYLAI